VQTLCAALAPHQVDEMRKTQTQSLQQAQDFNLLPRHLCPLDSAELAEELFPGSHGQWWCSFTKGCFSGLKMS